MRVTTSTRDDLLLQNCQRGDEASLAELVRMYQDRIYRLADRVLGDPAQAEEAAAEVFTKIWFKAESWNRQAAAGTWIYRVAMHAILDYRRRRERWWSRALRLVPGREGSSRHDPASGLAEAEERQAQTQQLRAAVAELTDADRGLIHLYYYEERSLAEIAEIMEVSRDALKMRLARARQRLREKLEPPGDH